MSQQVFRIQWNPQEANSNAEGRDFRFGKMMGTWETSGREACTTMYAYLTPLTVNLNGIEKENSQLCVLLPHWKKY